VSGIQLFHRLGTHSRFWRLLMHILWYLPFAIRTTMSQTAKLFTNGRSQAVRLPAAYRFDTQEVFMRKDPATEM